MRLSFNPVSLGILSLLAAALLLLVVTGCAPATRTQGVAFKNPAYDGAPLSSFMVEADGTGLQGRHALEQALTQHLRTAGLTAQASMDTAPPSQDYSPGQLRRILRDSGMAALITVTPVHREIIRSYTPPSRHHRRPSYDRFGHVYFDDGFMGAMLLEEPQVTYAVEIVSLPAMDKIWTGEFTTRGPTGMNFNRVGSMFARELVKRLAQDGVIAVR